MGSSPNRFLQKIGGTTTPLSKDGKVGQNANMDCDGVCRVDRPDRGGLALANPLAATITALTLTAWSFIATGVLQFVVVLGASGWSGRLWSGLIAAVFVVMGFSLLFDPLAGVLTLTWLVAILFGMSGITKIILAYGTRDTPFFWPVLLTGAVSILLAAMIIANFPASAATVAGVLLAVELISSGVAAIALALRLRRSGA